MNVHDVIDGHDVARIATDAAHTVAGAIEQPLAKASDLMGRAVDAVRPRRRRSGTPVKLVLLVLVSLVVVAVARRRGRHTEPMGASPSTGSSGATTTDISSARTGGVAAMEV